MVTQELIAYIKSQRLQGKTDEIIRNDLLASKWSESDISQAFLQVISSSASPVAESGAPQTSIFTPAQLQPQTYVSQENASAPSTEEKPKMIKTISDLIFFIAILYIFSTAMTLAIMLIMDRALSAEDMVFSFLKYFPSWGFMPIMFSFTALIFFYVALKVRNGSKFGFWMGVGSLLIIPLSVAFMSRALMSPLINLFSSNMSGITNEEISKTPVNLLTFRFAPLIFILAFISLVLLLVSYKKFHFSNDPISGKSKIFLVVLAIVLVLPTVFLVVLGYLKANDTDFGYTNAKSQVDYHIYKSNPIPLGLVNATKFVVGKKELAGKQNAVSVVYDVPFDIIIKTGQFKSIIVTEVGVESGFNLDTFVTTFMKDAIPQKITLPTASSQTGYLLQKPLGNSTLSTVVYLTNDNVLLMLESLKASPDELIQFASSLK